MLRALLLLISLLPGSAPILLGRELRGALLLIVGLNAWNLAFIGFFLWHNERWELRLGWTGLVVGVAASAGSFLWTASLTSSARRRRRREEAERALRTAYRAYLRGQTEEARTALSAGLRVNDRDRDLLFASWALEYQTRGGRRAWPKRRRLRRADRGRKWLWEIYREEELRGRGA